MPADVTPAPTPDAPHQHPHQHQHRHPHRPGVRGGGPLSIHIPEPTVRPGDTPDFSGVNIPRAGAAPRPAIDTPAAEMRDMAYSIIRVLNRKGEAVGPWAEAVAAMATEDALRQGLRDMMTMRAIDRRMQIAQRQGKTSFYVQCTGEEAIGCGVARMLNDGDMNFPTYRQQGLLVGRDYPMIDMFNQIYSNEADPMAGRQLPVLHSARAHGFFTISGNLGTQFVQAVGWAMASAMSGDDKIALGWIGDGATASSDFHSAMLNASVYRPPVVLNVVNNQWAISSHNSIAGSENATFAARAHGYGFPSIRVDGNDYLAVMAAASWAIERARANHGPTLIEWVTYRVAAHSTADDPSAYRPRAESDAWPLGDPIARLKGHLIAKGLWSEDRHVQAEAEILDGVIAVQREAEANGTLLTGRRVSGGDIFRDVYAEMPEHLRLQKQEMGL
jgi:2-oxoisovalerate dehydrogenase E1 component alpha subunit